MSDETKEREAVAWESSNSGDATPPSLPDVEWEAEVLATVQVDDGRVWRLTRFLANQPRDLCVWETAMDDPPVGVPMTRGVLRNDERWHMLSAIDRLTRERDEARALGEMEWQVDRRGAERLADEVAVLIRKGLLDARSPTGDALLDYRNPPSSPRADRLVTLERERDEAWALVEGANEAELEAIGDAEDLRARLARFEALAREAENLPTRSEAAWWEACARIAKDLADLAGPEGA